ncbi:MAG: DNA-3-methyladenine glycosylase [Candidatus Marinimicrobia bacterium]|nr:DNA-3-methyladenine glycosylase [Candidatus Neomarinimicrobiota bacterium]
MEYLKTATPKRLDSDFFDRDARVLAQDLLGKVLQVRQDNQWLFSRIIETEAYLINERGSHASLGNTYSRRALFMPPGTIYMYYARGGDSLNFSCQGEGNAVLIKSAFPLAHSEQDQESVALMLANNPLKNGKPRPLEKVCAGQTLLCRAMGLRVPDWNARQLDEDTFTMIDDFYNPSQIIQSTRLGIPPHRDAHLPYRFIDARYTKYSTKNPLSVRNWQNGKEYTIFSP